MSVVVKVNERGFYIQYMGRVGPMRRECQYESLKKVKLTTENAARRDNRIIA